MNNEFDYDSIDITADAPETEPERQRYFIAKCRAIVKAKSEELSRPLTSVVKTFGCPCVLITEKISQYPLLVL